MKRTLYELYGLEEAVPPGTLDGLTVNELLNELVQLADEIPVTMKKSMLDVIGKLQEKIPQDVLNGRGERSSTSSTVRAVGGVKLQ